MCELRSVMSQADQLMREADLTPIAARAEAAAACTYERYRRLPADVPARRTADRANPPGAPARS